MTDTLIAAILAGGLGQRLGHLTVDCPKPLVPYAGTCRMIDFSLENCRASALSEVLLMSKHMALPLMRYMHDQWSSRIAINFGRHGALLDGTSEAGADEPEERGTADALTNNRRYLERNGIEDVVVLHSDHIYNFDYRPMYAAHKASGAALTIGYQRIPIEAVSLFGMVEFDERGRLTQFVEKPANPTSDCVFTAVGIFNRSLMFHYLDMLARTEWAHDISFDLIPAMLQGGEAIIGYPFDDYWEDIGTIERYHRAHMRLVQSAAHLRAPVTLAGGGTIARFDLPDLATVVMPQALVDTGFVARQSLIFPGASIGPGAQIERCVLLPDALVGPDERLSDAVVSGHGRTLIPRPADG